SDREMQGRGDRSEDEAEDQVEDPDRNEADTERDGLRGVEFYKGPFVNQQEYESGDPAEDVADESSHVFVHAGCCGSSSRGTTRAGSGSGDRTLRCTTLGTKCCTADFCTAGTTKRH